MKAIVHDLYCLEVKAHKQFLELLKPCRPSIFWRFYSSHVLSRRLEEILGA